jgi:hypothetical protein
MQSLVNLQVVTAIRESMTEAEDIDGLRILYRFGCSFALHSLSQQVMVHERSFGEWVGDGETHHKRMFGLTHDGLECVDAVCARMTIDMWRVDEWTFADAVKRDIKGLAWAKASFASACMGWNCPCVDILALEHGYNMTSAEANAYRDKWTQWADYFRDCFLLFDMSAPAQWRAYADWSDTYDDSGHAVYFDALFAALGGLHVPPATPAVDPVARAAAKARTAAKRAATAERKAAAKAAAAAGA